MCHVHDCPRKTSTSCALFGGHAASLSQRFAESGATASAAPGHSDQRRPRRRSGVENPGLVRLVLVLPEMLIVRLGPLRSMCRRFAKPSKKATLEPSANSHRANARNSIFAGRQKGGKRQHKATANFSYVQAVGLHVGRLFLPRRKDLGDASTQQKASKGNLSNAS